MSIDLNIWAGDEPTFTWTLTDSSGTLDLTGATVTLAWELSGGGGAGSGAMTIVATGPSPAPQVSYTFAAGETDTEGVYDYEIRVDDGAGNVTTFPAPANAKRMRIWPRHVS